MSMNLIGKRAIVTGASHGLGLAIAKKLISSGVNLMICARDNRSLKNAYEELISQSASNQIILFQEADVSNISNVNLVVERVMKELGGCEILVNNAGIYGPKGDITSVDWHEWVRAIEINLFGSVLMSRSILPYFMQQKYGKIIQLSGGGATQPVPFISSYAVSKAAIVRFAETLAEEVRGLGIDVNSIAPGPLNTKMLEEVLAAGPNRVGKDFYEKSLKQKENGGASIDIATELVAFLASPASDGITGKLISAMWDNWESFPRHLSELNSSDIFTLRRIAGRDRGHPWGDK